MSTNASLLVTTDAETSSVTIAGHSDLIDGFAPGQPWATTGPWHFFFLVDAASELVRDGNIIQGTVRLVLFAVSALFKAYKACKIQLSAHNFSVYWKPGPKELHIDPYTRCLTVTRALS